jgi:hypothetical protein
MIRAVVLLHQHRRKELRCRAAFWFNQVFLAVRNIGQQSEAKRNVGLATEISDGLWLALFCEIESLLLRVLTRTFSLLP